MPMASRLPSLTAKVLQSHHQVKLRENKVIFAEFLSYPGPTLQSRSAAPVSVSQPIMLGIRPWEAQGYPQL